jgi:HSP20 family protein
MSNLTRFQPFRDLVNTDPFREFEDMFRDFRLFPALRGLDGGARIRMDISETDQAYRVTADIPGVKKEDIKISVDGSKVTISAEVRRETPATPEGSMLGSERFYGQQYRSFTLAHEVDESKADASYQDGVLELTLPKKPDSGGKQLTVH